MVFEWFYMWHVGFVFRLLLVGLIMVLNSDFVVVVSWFYPKRDLFGG